MKGYIFNLYQADRFIQKGAIVENVGLSRGKAYIKFKINNVFNELLIRWDNHTLD